MALKYFSKHSVNRSCDGSQKGVAIRSVLRLREVAARVRFPTTCQDTRSIQVVPSYVWTGGQQQGAELNGTFRLPSARIDTKPSHSARGG